MDEGRYRRKWERAEQKVAILERMIESKTRELFVSNEQLRSTNQELVELQRVIPGALILVDAAGTIVHTNSGAAELLECAESQLLNGNIRSFSKTTASMLDQLGPEHSQFQFPRYEDSWVTAQGVAVPVLVSASALLGAEGRIRGIVLIGVDLRERKNLEIELRHAQKLESIGQLAAGIAHEINTPMQFIGDNVHFLKDAFGEVLQLVTLFQERSASQWAPDPEAQARLSAAEEAADLDYLRERVPKAFERTLVGVGRVGSIVAAMKAFSHPRNEKSPTDLNAAIHTTLTVARNEYKYVAEIELELGDIPLVACHAGDMNQALLNLVVNAAHAIEEAKREGMGRITIQTRKDQDHVAISIRDTGVGIPQEIQHRVFDPFFTTKEVGKGTGQGLALVYNIVVNRHHGQIKFTSQPGVGTTFFLRVPILEGTPAPGRAA